MTLPVFWVPDLTGAAEHATVEVTGDEGHHAVTVRRVKPGEDVVLTDGAGTSVTGTVAGTAKRSMTVTVDAVAAAEPERPRITVVQAIPKGDRGEQAVEMLTEVGVDAIVPWSAARCIGQWRGDRAAKSLAKWRSTAREAAKQSRRTWFPEVREVATTAAVADLLDAASLPVVLHEAASGPLADLPVPGRGEIVVVVGPEGGISDEELAAFAHVGAEPVRLGSSVLRTSTAGVAAAAALLSRTPRWR